MNWARVLGYITGADQELLARQYLAAENRILKGPAEGQLISDVERASSARLVIGAAAIPRRDRNLARPDTAPADAANLVDLADRGLRARSSSSSFAEPRTLIGGYHRISRGLANLGYAVCRSTSGNVPQRHALRGERRRMTMAFRDATEMAAGGEALMVNWELAGSGSWMQVGPH